MTVFQWLETNWLSLGAAVLLVAFVYFAFEQGMKVRPLPPDEQPPDPYGGGGDPPPF